MVIHKPDRSQVAELPAIRDLVGQVDELLIVHNGISGTSDNSDPEAMSIGPIRSIHFDANRGTAAAWNAAMGVALDRDHRYLYLLDQDSVPAAGAVARALDEVALDGAAAVVQPVRRDLLGLDPFPWNSVASGSLFDVAALVSVGGFDERLFVDEVDHEVLARLVSAGHRVRPLRDATITHRTGQPRDVSILGRNAVVSGHSVERRRVQGFSAGVLIRRHLRGEPATSLRLLLRHSLTAAKDFAAGEQGSARALLSGLADGTATPQPPPRAAERACPYCAGPLLGRFGAVADWRFGTGSPADVYRCATCGALGAGRVPGDDEIAGWYDEYYTHSVEPARHRLWSRAWPTPRRRREMDEMRWYFVPSSPRGRFLEVGTGSGERLVQFADAGWEVVGQDLDPKAGSVARDRGIQVHQCPVDELVATQKRFDLIGLSHVLEHVTDQAALLRACTAMLAPGGRLCVISPNAQGLGQRLFGRLWFGLEQPRHLAIPTVASLNHVTAGLGLRTVRVGSAATNGAVILGGSLEGALLKHLPPGPLRRGLGFSLHCFGQAVGRAAFLLDSSLGEEVVWVGQRADT